MSTATAARLAVRHGGQQIAHRPRALVLEREVLRADQLIDRVRRTRLRIGPHRPPQPVIDTPCCSRPNAVINAITTATLPTTIAIASP